MTDICLKSAFEAFVRNPDFSCVGAKAALNSGALTIVEGRRIDRSWDDRRIRAALMHFGRALTHRPSLPHSLAVIFRAPQDLTETAFEDALWSRLQGLHDMDVEEGVPWDDAVASDPELPQFSMSVGGRAFFVVGLHPEASRLARRFAYPVLVFNPHAQFERLRRDGKYQRMQSVIRRRDEALQGAVNPMVEDFGHTSEARQYSGRAVDEAWRCPFSIKQADALRKAG